MKSPRNPTDGGASVSAGGYRDAESLFRSKPISEIRNVEAATTKEIDAKKEELRQLVGNRYRDLIDSADSIVLMKSSCQSISKNITLIHQGIFSLSSDATDGATPKLNPNRLRVYAIASRVKYLVDTPENIWGCLDESMFLESAARYIRAKQVHQCLIGNADKAVSNFPLVQHQWQIVESFKSQISQRSRERLMDRDSGSGVAAYADALAAVAVIDELDPVQVLDLFLDTRKTWISHKLGTTSSDSSCDFVVSVFCEVLMIIQVSLGQVGELFLQVLNDMPLFYKVILGTPPVSQLFGRIPNPDEEVRLWKSFREKLESVMGVLPRDFVAKTCSRWLRECGQEIVNRINGRYLIDAVRNGEELAAAEKLMRETMDGKQVLEGSLDWLRSVFGSEIEMPWNRVRELVLEDNTDLWDEMFEAAFVHRMKAIVDAGFEDLTRVVNINDSIRTVQETNHVDFQAYLRRLSTGGGVWFVDSNVKKGENVGDYLACLNAYFGPEVSRIRDAVDSRCENVLKDLLCFLESPKASDRLKDLVSYLQNKCYESISTIVMELKSELEHLFVVLDGRNMEAVIVERALFIGRLLFAFQNHSRHIPVILGSPRLWASQTMGGSFDKLPSLLRHSRMLLGSPAKQTHDEGLRRQTSLATTALFGVSDSPSPKFEELRKLTRDLCIKAHDLWISWVSDELSAILSRDLRQDDGLSATTALRGWEETVVTQEQPTEGQSEMKLSLPSMPSLYITSFLFRACEEVHRVGGHVLNKQILQKFALRLLEKVIGIYRDFVLDIESGASQVSEKGVLQILLDLRFSADVLSGGDSTMNEGLPKSPMGKLPFRQKRDQNQSKSVNREVVVGLVNRLSQRLDPIDWLTYEPYLWENERQSYLRHGVLFGFFVQLNRMFTDTVQKLASNSESNILRCSTVPRFKLLPISAPALSSRGPSKTSVPTSTSDFSSRSSWKAYSNGELSPKLDFDDTTSFGVATPFLKSFMQVGSRFGESTLKLGNMLTDGQVGRFKDKSAAAMSTFGDILPVQAAGLLSSLTATGVRPSDT